MNLRYVPFDITQPELARQVVALQQISYPIEAELIGLDVLPPMLDTVETLTGCEEQFIGCFEADRLVGAVSYKFDGAVVDIHRMMVHPAFFRRGIAQTLLHNACSTPGAKKAIVSTGSANYPAVTLYERNGFIETKRVEVAPGVTITLFNKNLVT
jgi:ribosomal protein S18 acetylase RimI-like enzyme